MTIEYDIMVPGNLTKQVKWVPFINLTLIDDFRNGKSHARHCWLFTCWQWWYNNVITFACGGMSLSITE
jgi:hypothetical protein